MNIEQQLRSHKEKLARISILQLELDGLEAELSLSTGITESDDETISSLMFRVSQGSGGNGEVSSKTERIALNYKDEQDRLNQPSDISELYENIRNHKNEIRQLKSDVELIRIAIEGLNEKERLIIVEHYINNNSWNTVSVRYQQIYTYPIMQSGCSKIKKCAFSKLKRILIGH